MEVSWDRLNECVFRVLESDLQSFRRHQAHGLLRKLHDTVGVHQDLNGPRGRAPALQHLQGAELRQCSRGYHTLLVPCPSTQDDQPAKEQLLWAELSPPNGMLMS